MKLSSQARNVKCSKHLRNDKRKGTETFYRLFKTFADRFRMSGYDEGYLSGEPTLVTAAYGNFPWVFKGRYSIGSGGEGGRQFQ